MSVPAARNLGTPLANLVMVELIRAFADIMLRRRGPQDLPASGFLLGVTLVVYLLTQMPVALLLPGGAARAVSVVVVDAALIGASLCAAALADRANRPLSPDPDGDLRYQRAAERPGVPFYLWRAGLSEPQLDAALPTAAIMLFLIWSFVVGGHILANALSQALRASVS